MKKAVSCQYKAVLFDVGETLICTSRSIGEFYAETASRYGVEVVPGTLDSAFRRLWTERRNTLHAGTSEELERQWWYHLVADTFARAGRGCQPPKRQFEKRFEDFFNELYDIFARPETWRVFPDVEPALAELRGLGVRLAVVSNWDSRLEVLLRRLGLAERFEFILTSARAGYRKPDAGIFRVALERLGVYAGEAAHVGDSYEDDVVGARNAGIRPVLIDRRGGCPPDTGAIGSLAELAAVLCGPA